VININGGDDDHIRSQFIAHLVEVGICGDIEVVGFAEAFDLSGIDIHNTDDLVGIGKVFSENVDESGSTHTGSDQGDSFHGKNTPL
jgi:hypothetical protein